MSVITFLLGLKLGIVEWLAILLAGVVGVQTLRLKGTKQRAVEAENGLFKAQLAATEPVQKAALAARLKETENARKRFEESSGAYERARDADKPWRPSDK